MATAFLEGILITHHQNHYISLFHYKSSVSLLHNLKRCTPFWHETFVKRKRHKYRPLNVNWVSRLVSKLCYPNSKIATKNSAFYPQSMFMCFVWFSPRKLISPNSIKWLVFLMDIHTDLEVRSVFLVYNLNESQSSKTIATNTS